jgi:hypothetical protein
MRLSFAVVLDNQVDIRLSSAEKTAPYAVENADGGFLGLSRIVVEYETFAEAKVLLCVVHHVEIDGVCDETLIIDTYEAS